MEQGSPVVSDIANCFLNVSYIWLVHLAQDSLIEHGCFGLRPFHQFFRNIFHYFSCKSPASGKADVVIAYGFACAECASDTTVIRDVAIQSLVQEGSFRTIL